MAKFTLFEKYNPTKLAQVLVCNNLPKRLGKEADPYWRENFKKRLDAYGKLPVSEDGKVRVVYSQRGSYGRYYADCKKGVIITLQGCKGDVRRYISGEFYVDIDIINCHPVLLMQLFEKCGIDCGDTLREYIKDREAFMTKYSLTDKKDLMKMMNNQTLKIDSLHETHTQIYTHLIPHLMETNLDLFKERKAYRIAKGKDYNHMGAFIAIYLQNIEKDILLAMTKWAKHKKLVTGVSCYDGFMVDKTDSLDEGIFVGIEAEVLKKTGYAIQLAFKSTEAEWSPIVGVDKVVVDAPITVGSSDPGVHISSSIVSVVVPVPTTAEKTSTRKVAGAKTKSKNTTESMPQYQKANQMFSFSEDTLWTVQKQLKGTIRAEPMGCLQCLVNPSHCHQHSSLLIDISKGRVTKSCSICGNEDFTKSEAKRAINIFMVIMKVEAPEDTVYQTLVGKLLRFTGTNEYRRQKGTGNVMVPIRPYSYVRHPDAAKPMDFINRVFFGDNDFKSAPNNMDNMTKFLRQTDDPSFPFIEYDKDWLGFQNGALNTVTCAFTESPPFRMVVRKYFDQEFTKGTDTPLMDSVLDYQFSPDVRDFMYMIAGRMFGIRDNLAFMLFLLGEPGTGKSTFLDVVCAFFNDVGAIGDTYETKFGLSFLYDKDIVVCDDLPKNISTIFPSSTFQSCVSGGKVAVAFKGGDGLTVDGWNVPLLWSGNLYPDYLDKGQVTRRVMVANHQKNIINTDTTLFDKIVKNELPALMYKCLLAYKAMLDKKHTGDVWSFCPQYFNDQQREMKIARNPLFSFLVENAFFLENEVTDLGDVRDRFGEAIGKKVRTLDNGTFGQVNTAYTVFTLAICKHCKLPHMKGCCDEYSSADKTSKKVINNMKLKSTCDL